MALLAPLHFHRRFHAHQGAHLLLGLRQSPLDPMSLPVWYSDCSLKVIDPTDHMLVLLPQGAPHGDIIKATVGDPGDRLTSFE